MEFKGSKTEKNIMTAFSSESETSNKYKYFASIAKKEGFIKVANTFNKVANYETQHANHLFSFLKDSNSKVDNDRLMMITSFGDTRKNLAIAVKCEQLEQNELYNKYEKEAITEGFDGIAKIFKSISNSEKYHEIEFRALLNHMQEGNFFVSIMPGVWKCMKCGYQSQPSKECPKQCPACNARQSHFDFIELEYKLLDKVPH